MMTPDPELTTQYAEVLTRLVNRGPADLQTLLNVQRAGGKKVGDNVSGFLETQGKNLPQRIQSKMARLAIVYAVKPMVPERYSQVYEQGGLLALYPLVKPDIRQFPSLLLDIIEVQPSYGMIANTNPDANLVEEGSRMFEDIFSTYQTVVRDIAADRWEADEVAQAHFTSAFGLVMGNAINLRDQYQAAFSEYVEAGIESIEQDVNDD